MSATGCPHWIPKWTVQELILKQHFQTRLRQFLNQIACLLWQGQLGMYQTGAPIHPYYAQGPKTTVESTIEKIAELIATHAFTFWMGNAQFLTQARQYFPDKHVRRGVCNMFLENLPCYVHLSAPQQQRILINFIEQVSEFVIALSNESRPDSLSSSPEPVAVVGSSAESGAESLPIRKFVHSVFFALWNGWLSWHNSNLANVDASPRPEQCDWINLQHQAVEYLVKQLDSHQPINWTRCFPFFDKCSPEQQQCLVADFSALVQDGIFLT